MSDSLIVRAGGETHAIALTEVVEVLRMVAVTSQPDLPAWALGTIDRRGETTTVIDLAARLGLPSHPPTISSRIVVCRADGRTFGAVVDDAEALASAAHASAVEVSGLIAELP
jgi:chemotaxis signal transduction protein